ncbi:MAG: CBS domain-containing protein [Tissierellia bacterium]|nr:CBS domain-containing protein [Tissierellia bacterium]
MFVKNHILAKEFLTLLSKEDTVQAALSKMEEGKFLSLPIVDGNHFVGYVMKQDIYSAFFQDVDADRNGFLNRKIEEFMVTDIKSLDPEDGIDEASYAIEKLNIPFLPVINKDGYFLGILTHAAIFKAFADLFQLDKGKQMVIYVFNIPGQLSRLLNVFRKEDVNVASMVVMDAKVMGILKVMLRVETEDMAGLISKVEKEGFKTGHL